MGVAGRTSPHRAWRASLSIIRSARAVIGYKESASSTQLASFYLAAADIEPAVAGPAEFRCGETIDSQLSPRKAAIWPKV